jgi:hypothetical protein
MFQAGGTDIYLHKYLGPRNPSQDESTADQPRYPNGVAETNIQDLLFLENRDRKYESEIYRMRTIYAVQQTDWNLSQFGLFIDNDTINISVHINDIIKTIGRKPLSGDVFELPHLKDLFALNDLSVGMPRYYVIEDVTLESGGYSVTWYPHLYRLKCKRILDSQQFADILDKPATDADGNPMVNEDGSTKTSLRDLLSVHNKELEINDRILQQAEVDAPKSGYETRQFYTMAVDPLTGKQLVQTVDETELDASNSSYSASATVNKPLRTGYTGYLVGDGFPANVSDPAMFGHGIQFPPSAGQDDYFLRTDFLPNRLFRFDSGRWIKVEDAVRMTMTNDDPTNPNSTNRLTQKTGFINNSNDYIYNDIIISDYIELTVNQTIIDTDIEYKPANIDFAELYVEFKLSILQFGYDALPIITSYLDGDVEKVRITLPITQKIKTSGTWRISLCRNREAVRQSLSQALRPGNGRPTLEADV